MYETTLEIDGMMCGMCESHINDAIRAAFKIKKVSSSHAKGKTVILSETALDRAKLRQVIEKTGYQLRGVHSAVRAEKKGCLFGLFHK